ncbi:hypothetical protein ACFVW1_25490 [Streptomyces olivochromogenes]|uniref:hypothetical protein n=1 Tax=Streptomyces olivochromogenes TaxID=1963 RepID=UPI0036DDB348
MAAQGAGVAGRSSLTWTDHDGTRQASAVSYDKTSAEQRKQQLEGAGRTNMRCHPQTI